MEVGSNIFDRHFCRTNGPILDVVYDFAKIRFCLIHFKHEKAGVEKK